MNSDLVITGANGFVGTSFLEFLSTLDDHQLPKNIYLIGRSEYFKNNQTLEKLRTNTVYLKADLTKEWDFEIQRANLINLAADGSATSYSDEACESFIQIGKNMVNWVTRNSVSALFHASSGAVTSSYRPLSSDSFLGRSTTSKVNFIESRKFVEKLLNDCSKKDLAKIKVARLFSFIGPNILEKKQYAVSSFIHQAVSNREIDVLGNPKSIRSYLNHKDLSRTIHDCLSGTERFMNFSIGSTDEITMAELAEFIASETNSSVKYSNIDAPGDYYAVELESEIDKLATKETVNWQESIRECLRFAKENCN